MATVLIVEDDPIIRLAGENAMQEWGYQTLTASDVDEAMEILRSPQPIDVLFTDIYLKTEAHGGCDVARKGLDLRPDLRVLYVTGYTLIPKVRAMFVKDAECIGKPYTEAALKASIANLLPEKLRTGSLAEA
jgi:DNA-binding NtrC family response regulator